MKWTVLLLLPCLAFANGNHDRNSHGDSDADAVSSATSDAVSDSRATAVIGDININTIPDSAGTAASFAEGSIRGGDVTIENPDKIEIRNVPSLRAPYMNATAPCRIALSAGVTLVGGGVSGGASVEDKECTRRQSAQTWAAMGVPGMGLWLMCRSLDMDRAGMEPEDCEAMVAQLQIAAELDEEPVIVYETPEPILLAEVDEEEFEELKALVYRQQQIIDDLEQRPEPEPQIIETRVEVVEDNERYSKIRSRLLAIPRVEKVTQEELNERTEN